MTAPVNTLADTVTKQQGSLELLENFGPFCSPEVMNMKFREFNKTAINNYGNAVSISVPVRYVSQGSLVVNNFQGTEQKFETLVCGVEDKVNPDNSTVGAVPLAFDAQEITFNVANWLDDFGRSAVAELADRIQRNVAKEVLNSYRFYGATSGSGLINSYGQLDKARRKLNNFGSALGKRIMIIPDTAASDILNNGLDQFAVDRGNEDANSWKIAAQADTIYYTSNLLPQQTAGAAGDENIQLTLTAVNPDGTELTLSGAGTLANAARENDILMLDNLNATRLVFLTWIGHGPSQQRPSVRITADADSVGDVLVVTVDPPLIVAGTPNTTPNANLNIDPLTADAGSGVGCKIIPSHTAGILMGGNPFFLAMPPLPDQSPYETANNYDERTGVSIRLTKGAQFGGNTYGYVLDGQWGKKIFADYVERLIFPLDGGF